MTRQGLLVDGLPPAWQPPADLETFLSEGPPPVCIGFGSVLSVDADNRLSYVIATAGPQAGARMMIQGCSQGKPRTRHGSWVRADSGRPG